VSPSYAREIQHPEEGFGLDGVLRRHAGKLRGILNGADYDRWDPAHDPLIAAPYSPDDLSGKEACRRALLEEVGLPPDSEYPVAGMTTRLVDQKGVDLVLAALPDLMFQGLGLIILGTGDAGLEKAFLEARRRHARLRVTIGFSEEKAHRILAGADLFLMPSRYEPCGLSQIYSLRYGTVPVVRSIGGLRDTVEQVRPALPGGTGFLFEEASPTALVEAVGKAIAARENPDRWREIIRTGMSKDFSWRRPAAEYLALYRELIPATGARNPGKEDPT
jgi:starch synthase